MRGCVRGCGHRRPRAKKPCAPSGPGPEGPGNTAARLWVYFHGMFSTPGTQGRCAAPLQPPLAGSTVTSSPVRLASTSQAANWDTSPRRKRLDKRLQPHESPLPAREGGERGEVQAQRVPAGCQPSHRRPSTACPAHHHRCIPQPSPQEQQLPRGYSFRAPRFQQTRPHISPRPGDTQRGEAQPQLLPIHTFMAANS